MFFPLLWAGSGGHTTPLHFDTYNGVLCHVSGVSKTFYIWPTEQPAHMVSGLGSDQQLGCFLTTHVLRAYLMDQYTSTCTHEHIHA
jgi:hypothetical protein